MTIGLFSPLDTGLGLLAHRVVMAPLTRMRAARPGNEPVAINAAYYGQRATPGGLIIAEAAPISASGRGMPGTPGLHSPAQLEGWRAVTQAVHARGGLIVAQLWHVGRISHSSHQPGGAPPVAPSAIAAVGQAMDSDFGRAPFETPRALATGELPGVIADYAQAAANARDAGFDGVEIHAANGYLLEQFLQTRSNQRTDAYGGSIANRARLLIEVGRAVCGVWDASRVGVRLSPWGVANDSGEADPMPLYGHAVSALAGLGLGYLHLIEPRASGAGQAEVDHQGVPSAARMMRPLWPRVLIAAGNFRKHSAEAAIAGGDADAIAFGRLFISNPDLPDRLRHDAPLTPYDRTTFYGGGERGYTDYPALAAD